MRYFEDYTVGSKTRLKTSYQFTEEEIIEFATRWDPQPFHVNIEEAKESIFDGIVACSSHIIAASIRVASLDEETKTAAVSALGFKEIKLFAPVRPGDTLYSEEEVLEVRLSNSRPGCGIVVARNSMHNQHDELVLNLQAAALVECRPQA